MPGLEIHLLGLPDGFSRDEVEGWIGSLASASREGAVAASPDDPIPPVLRHVLGGLLFSHAELWGRGAGGPVSVVLVSEHGQVALGWVGDASARIFEDGHEVAPEWVSVRDHQGRESRAWCGDAHHDLRIELVCAPDSASGPTPVELEAHWTAGNPDADLASVAAPPVRAAEDSVPRTDSDAPPSAADPAPMGGWEAPQAAERAALGDVPPVGSGTEPPIPGIHQGERPSSGVARWLSRALGLGKKAHVTEQDAPSPTDPTAEPPAPEAGAADDAGSPEPAASNPAPEASEPESASSQLVEGDEGALPDPIATHVPARFRTDDEMSHVTRVHDEGGLAEPIDLPLPPGVPDEIPPTPEPPSLTERAVRAGFGLEDPRAISLPGHTGRQGAGSTPASDTAPAAPPAWTPSREPAPARTPEPEIRPVDLSGVAMSPGEEAVPREPAIEESIAHAGGRTRLQPPRRPEWPEAPSSDAHTRPDLVRWGLGAAFVVLLFGAGWLVGQFQGGKADHQRPSALVGLLRKIGIAGARFETTVTSRPPGATIVVDGKDSGLRAPATVEMSPGEHRVDLSFADLGSVSFMVKGAKGDKVPLDAGMWGAVDVTVSDPSTPIAVAVDGESRGFAPMTLDSLAPGPHELRFTGPGMASWGTTIETRVGETREVLAYPLQSPATGLLQVRAVLNQDGESQPLAGARVFVDGEPRGQTPLTLELPRGPHSVRVAHQQETGPVQVIDLPGGNQRFSTFEFGLNLEYPVLTLRAPALIPPDEPVLISATLGQVAAADVREMWLHARTPDNRWRRYPMTLIEAQGSAVGAAPFPAVLLGPDGTASYYVSALTGQGDEYFTEMQKASAAKPRPAR